MEEITFNKWRIWTYGKVIGWSLVLYNFVQFAINICLMVAKAYVPLAKIIIILFMLLSSIYFILKYPPKTSLQIVLYRSWLTINIVVLNCASLFTDHKSGNMAQNGDTVAMLFMGIFMITLFSAKYTYAVCLLSLYFFEILFAHIYSNTVPINIYTTITPVIIGSFVFRYIFDRSIKQAYYSELCIKKQAITDPLTRLYTRQFLPEQIIHDECMLFSGVAIMLDIDKFKAVNDTYGHIVGDKLLVEFAKLLKLSVRSTDYFIRFGGEEFVLFLPFTSLEQGKLVADGLRKKCENASFDPKFTISCGVTDFVKGERFEKVIARADEKLYKAKTSGRNCVV